MGSGERSSVVAARHFDVGVYKLAHEAAMRVFEMSKVFPKEEAYALTDQIRRSSRSVCANFAEAWRKRMYVASFVSKLTDCEAEAAETQTWLKLAVECGYLDREDAAEVFKLYDETLSMLVSMRRDPQKWTLPGAK